MKKLLGIVVISLLLSSNAYALFHKLPTLKCTITPAHENAQTFFLKLNEYWSDKDDEEYNRLRVWENTYTSVKKTEKTYKEENWIKTKNEAGKILWGKKITYIIDRNTGGLTLTVSPKYFPDIHESAAKLFEVETTVLGTCVKK